MIFISKEIYIHDIEKDNIPSIRIISEEVKDRIRNLNDGDMISYKDRDNNNTYTIIPVLDEDTKNVLDEYGLKLLFNIKEIIDISNTDDNSSSSIDNSNSNNDNNTNDIEVPEIIPPIEPITPSDNTVVVEDGVSGGILPNIDRNISLILNQSAFDYDTFNITRDVMFPENIVDFYSPDGLVRSLLNTYDYFAKKYFSENEEINTKAYTRNRYQVNNSKIGTLKIKEFIIKDGFLPNIVSMNEEILSLAFSIEKIKIINLRASKLKSLSNFSNGLSNLKIAIFKNIYNKGYIDQLNVQGICKNCRKLEFLDVSAFPHITYNDISSIMKRTLHLVLHHELPDKNILDIASHLLLDGSVIYVQSNIERFKNLVSQTGRHIDVKSSILDLPEKYKKEYE